MMSFPSIRSTNSANTNAQSVSKAAPTIFPRINIAAAATAAATTAVAQRQLPSESENSHSPLPQVVRGAKQEIAAQLEKTAYDHRFLHPYFIKQAVDVIVHCRRIDSGTLQTVEQILDRFQQGQLKIILLDYVAGKMSSVIRERQIREFYSSCRNLTSEEKHDMSVRTQFLVEKLVQGFKEKDEEFHDHEKNCIGEYVQLALLREYYPLYPNNSGYSNFLGAFSSRCTTG